MNKAKNKKIRVGILTGGPSSEHEVSVASAAQVYKFLDKSVYAPVVIKVSKAGVWPRAYQPDRLRVKIDVAFIAMHGAYGEDGTLQGVLESNNIPYTGSGILASALAMDKWRSGLLAERIGLNAPLSILGNNAIPGLFKNKVVVKPNNGGSSIGVHIIPAKQLPRILNSKKSMLIVQEYIEGREFTVSVLGNENAYALPVIEIVPRAKFYDYEAKYAQGGSEHIVPAKISADLTQQLQMAALQIHIALGCKGVSRSDFIVSVTGKPYYLETNTVPGVTATSLLPQAAEADGIAFASLLHILITTAL